MFRHSRLSTAWDFTSHVRIQRMLGSCPGYPAVLIQLPANVSGRPQIMAQILVFLSSALEAQMAFLALTWPDSGCFRHLESKPTDRRPLCFSLFLCYYAF